METETVSQNSDQSQTESGIEGWVILELMGHRRLAGRRSKVELGGSIFLRIDAFGPDNEEPWLTQFYGVAAIFCVTPTDEKTARAIGKKKASTPVALLALPEDDRSPYYEEEDAPY